MRPAPPGEPLSNGDAFGQNGPAASSADAGGEPAHSRSAGRWAIRLGAIVVVAGLVAGGLIFLRGDRAVGPSPSRPPTSPPAPPREAFVFPLARVRAVTIGKANGAGVRDAAAKAQATLSGFYDAVFMDPRAWKEGVAPETWNAFARSVRDQARGDAEALTLGPNAMSIATLSVTDASLSIRVLLDPGGRPRAAVATVVFDASGTLAGGEPVVVSNRASFLLEPAGERWLVVGYPKAETEVETPSPVPSPGASGSPSPTASESASPGPSP